MMLSLLSWEYPAGWAAAGLGRLAMTCYWGICMFLFAEERILVTTIYWSENVCGFPYPENYLEIGSAMLSLVRYYQQTIQATTSADRANIIRWALFVIIIFTTTKDQDCFLVPSNSSRSTAHHPVLIAELSLKQRIEQVSLLHGSGGCKNSVMACFFRTPSSNSLLHLSTPTSISSITFHQHDHPVDPV